MRPSCRVAVAALAAAMLSGLLAAPGNCGEPSAPPSGGTERASDAGAPAETPEPEKPANPPEKQPAATHDPVPEPAPVPLPRLATPGTERKPRSLLVLVPRTIGYRVFLERLHVGSDGDGGSKIKSERDFGLSNVHLVSPDINVELNTEVLGLLARLHFTYTDNELYGWGIVPKDIRFGRTLFPAGCTVGTSFHSQRVHIRYVQEVFHDPMGEVDVSVGSEYFYIRNKVESPGLARQEEVSEAALPVFGVAGWFGPAEWGRVYARAQGFYWNLGKDVGEAGTFEFASGLSLRLMKGWGVNVGFSALWLTMAEGRSSRVRIWYLDYGPEVAIYASL
jgi:hypothetical protein